MRKRKRRKKKEGSGSPIRLRRRAGGQRPALRRKKYVNIGENERRNVIFRAVHKACHIKVPIPPEIDPSTLSEEEKKEREENESNMQKEGRKMFTWFREKLKNIEDEIATSMFGSSNKFMEDVSIIPLEAQEFEWIFENRELKTVMKELGFLAPSEILGSAWWKIPRGSLSLAFFAYFFPILFLR